jgi:hypothetical protein
MKIPPYLTVLNVEKDAWYKSASIGISGLFKSITQTLLVFEGTKDPISAGITGGKKFINELDYTRSPSHRAFDLISNAIESTCATLVNEVLLKGEKLKCTRNEALLIAQEMGKKFEDIEVQITKDFFNTAHELPALQDLKPVLRHWLIGLLLPDDKIVKIIEQLPAIFSDRIRLEWDKYPIYYKPIFEVFQNPFNSADEARYHQKVYYEELSERVNEPCLKDAKLTLKDLYIKPDFLVYSKSMSFHQDYNFVMPIYTDYTGNLHDYLLARLLRHEFPLNLKAEQRLIFLLGQPGQGKSSLCTYLSYQLLYNNDFTKKLYLIRLRDVEDNVQLIQKPFEVLEKHLKEEHQLQVQWKEPVLLILDGLDELYMSNGLTNEDLRQFYKALEQKIKHNKKLTILLTSRHHYLNIEEDVDTRRTTILKLAPFSLEQQKQWLSVYKRQHPNIKLTASKLEDIQYNDELKPIRELIEQPILLHLIAKADMDLEQQRVNRAMIYQQLFDRIMNRDWAEEQLEKYARLQTEQSVQQRFRAWLQEIAFTIYNSEQQYITIKDFQDLPVTKAFLNDKCIDTTEKMEDAAKDLLVAFYFKKSKQKGAERLRGNQAIEFLHKSLQEYLAVEHSWHLIMDLVKINPSDIAVLKLFSELFAQKPLNENMREMMKEIIQAENLEVRRQVRERLKQALPFCLEHQFLYTYTAQSDKSDKRTPFVKMEACFKSFWFVFVHLAGAEEPNGDLWGNEMKDGVATLLRTFGGMGMKLNEADLSRADLNGANLNGADLNRAKLNRANLSGVDLSGAYLNEVDFVRADLSGADLSGAILSGAYLNEADLRAADLRAAYLIEADLRQADLRGAKTSSPNFFQELQQHCTGIEVLTQQYYVDPTKQYSLFDRERKTPYYQIKKR